MHTHIQILLAVLIDIRALHICTHEKQYAEYLEYLQEGVLDALLGLDNLPVERVFTHGRAAVVVAERHTTILLRAF